MLTPEEIAVMREWARCSKDGRWQSENAPELTFRVCDDIPRLLDEVERLRKALDVIKDKAINATMFSGPKEGLPNNVIILCDKALSGEVVK